MITADGEVKLSDFGIARMFGNTRLTADGGVLGTAEYMAPEQASGGAVTERSDQYSLGGLMYSLLAGRAPFRAKTLVEMLQLQRYAEPEPVTRYAPDTPAELARIVHQLLDKDPQKRFSNTMILGRSLEAMERGLSISMSRGDDLCSRRRKHPSRRSPATTRNLRRFRRRSWTASWRATTTQATRPIFRRPKRRWPMTSTFPKAAAAAEENPSAASDTGSGRFVKVDEHASPLSEESEEHGGLFSPQTWLLVAALVLLLATGWYLMQPPRPIDCSNASKPPSADGDLDQMKEAKPDIESVFAALRVRSACRTGTIAGRGDQSKPSRAARLYAGQAAGDAQSRIGGRKVSGADRRVRRRQAKPRNQCVITCGWHGSS